MNETLLVSISVAGALASLSGVLFGWVQHRRLEELRNLKRLKLNELLLHSQGALKRMVRHRRESGNGAGIAAIHAKLEEVFVAVSAQIILQEKRPLSIDPQALLDAGYLRSEWERDIWRRLLAEPGSLAGSPVLGGESGES